MLFDAVLFDNEKTRTHRTSPVAAVRALAARAGVVISEEEAARYWRRSPKYMGSRWSRRNGGGATCPGPITGAAYVAAYAPFEQIAVGLAVLMYDQWKTNPLTMVPYPDAPAVLKSFSVVGIPIAIVSNTGVEHRPRLRGDRPECVRLDVRAVL